MACFPPGGRPGLERSRHRQVLAAASARFVRGFLYGVAEHDLWTLMMVTLILIVSGSLAAYFPARKAAQVDPIEALRAE